jgi:hypothetical protein
MKNFLTLAVLLLFISVFAVAQVPIDTAPKTDDGIDILSVGIGLVVGVVIGYLVGSRAKK